MTSTIASAAARPTRFAGRPLHPRVRLAAAVLLAACLIIVGFIVLTPGAPAAGGQDSLRDYLDLMHAQGRLRWLTFGLIESAANVVMFVPIGLLAAAAVRPARRLWMIPAAAAVSACVELAQKWFIAGRVSSVHDVVTNTVGAALGVLILLLLSRWRRLHR